MKGLVKKMKRFLATVMAAVLTASVLAGCGSSSADEKNLSNIDVEKYVLSVGEYKGLELTGEQPEITEEYLQSYVDYMLENSKEPVAVTGRPVQVGDVVNIDYEGKKDGVAFEGGTAQGYDLEIGSGSFIDGFEDGLIGCSVGDTVDLNLTFPEQYPSEELAGQAVVFTVTVNSISELVTPELTDEFVQTLGVENVEQFYQEVRLSLEEGANDTYQKELKTQVTEKLMEICDFSDEVPEGLFTYYKEQIYANFESQAASMGLSLTDFLSLYYGMTQEQFEADIETGAANSARQAMAFVVIAEKEGLLVTDEELNTSIEENYAYFGYESADDFKKNDNPEDYRDYLLTTKVLDFLLENAVVTEPAVTEPVEEETIEAATEEAATE